MKKGLIFIAMLLCIAVSDACPICGCGVGGFYIGLLPANKSKFLGLRYQYAHYETRLFNDPGQFSHDYYHQVELYGGLSLGNRWQLLGFVPYHINHQITDDGVVDRSGPGDVTLLINYKLFSSTGQNNATGHRQDFWIGAGIKLPTGKYNVNFADSTGNDLDDLLGDVNSQMGTGSTDFIINAMYNVQMGSFGINTTANYKLNTINNSHFKYGNRLSINSFAYYQAHAGNKIFVAPNVGVLYEKTTINRLAGDKVKETGGYAALASAGIDINLGKITMGTNIQVPFVQDYAQGQTSAKLRGLVHVTYTF